MITILNAEKITDVTKDRFAYVYEREDMYKFYTEGVIFELDRERWILKGIYTIKSLDTEYNLTDKKIQLERVIYRNDIESINNLCFVMDIMKEELYTIGGEMINKLISLV